MVVAGGHTGPPLRMGMHPVGNGLDRSSNRHRRRVWDAAPYGWGTPGLRRLTPPHPPQAVPLPLKGKAWAARVEPLPYGGGGTFDRRRRARCPHRAAKNSNPRWEPHGASLRMEGRRSAAVSAAVISRLTFPHPWHILIYYKRLGWEGVHAPMGFREASVGERCPPQCGKSSRSRSSESQ